ncbi:MAG: TIGR00282 family metallophosphoesterase [Mycoplasmoidaceae bacterium]
MKILFIGDISGDDGKIAIAKNVLELRKKYAIDFVIANGENTSFGRGLIKTDYEYLKVCGIDFLTMGNHTWFHKNEIAEILKNKDIIRPLNLNAKEKISQYGKGTRVVNVNGKSIRITNLIGSSVHFHDYQTNPFQTLEELLNQVESTDLHIIDFHCETTSESNAFFLNFKGRVSAILGTHTHVATNDYKIRDETAYITDVGMTGNQDGVIGAKPEDIISVFKGEKERFKLETISGNYQFNSVLLEFKNNKPISIEPIIIYERE